MSADTIVPDPTNPQDLNRFSYVRNNPLKYTDPTGHACVEGTSYCVNSATGQTSGNLSGWTGIGDAAPLSQSQYCDRYPWACSYNNEEEDIHDGQCTNVMGQTGGCVHYVSVAVGLDAPTIALLSGAGLSYIGFPEVGMPVALAGAAFEACAFTGTPLCAVVKLLSVNISGTVDGYGNLYLGPQISWGKSVLPFVAVSDYLGTISSGNNSHIPTESETRDTLSGFSVSAGSIATGSISYSPLADTYHTSYYLVGFPEVFSINVNYNFYVHDFSP